MASIRWTFISSNAAMLHVKIVFWIFSLASVFTGADISVPTLLYDTSASDAAVEVLHRSFEPKTSNVFVQIGCGVDHHYMQLIDVVDNVILRTSTNITYMIEENNILPLKNELRFYNLMFVDGYEGFRYSIQIF